MEGMMTTTQAAELAGVSQQRIRKLIDDGRFPSAVLIGPPTRGVWLLDKAEVKAWASSERRPGRPKLPKRAEE